MNLGTLHTIFSKLDNDSFVFKNGFGNPMSYRGDFTDCVFDHDVEISLSIIKQNIDSALTHKFVGLGSTEYRFSYLSGCYLADYCRWGDDNDKGFENLIGKMLLEYYSV